jgi:type I restriction enzyme M protein
VKLDDVLESLENQYPDKLKGLLPRIYAGSNMDAVSVRGLINLFSKDIFEADHGGDDLIGRVYEYFIGEFASREGKRGGEYFTPVSIVKTLVAMLEPEKGVVFDPCCGSGGMFVQSDLFTKHSHQLSFVGQESKDFTYRLCRMNLFIHGLDANIQLGNSYFDDKHATLKADYVLANPPFNDGSKGENGWGADRIADKDPRLPPPHYWRPEDGALAPECQHHVDVALPLPPERRRDGRVCDGHGRAVERRNGAAGPRERLFLRNLLCRAQKVRDGIII